MSRNILQNHKPYIEEAIHHTTNGKVIITSYQEYELALLIKENRLLAVYPLDNTSKVGAIYIGKVKNVVKNLNACFVEISGGEICFLPFQEAQQPLLLNRKYDGRLVQGDELLVQVQRDALKTKQTAITCNITLQGKYFVFAVGSSKPGISNKLPNEIRNSIINEFRERDIVDEQGFMTQITNVPIFGCVIRTEGGNLFTQDKESFFTIFQEELKSFMCLFETALHRTCFSCIKAPKKPYEAFLSYFRDNEYEEVLTDLPEAYTSLQEHLPNVRLYNDSDFTIWKLYALETKLKEALSKTIWLKSGANLVIEQTECLTTIDVNSGKMIKGALNEVAVAKINEEAAKEAALQIRLRNLSGIIIIDFINMKDKPEEERLIEYMKELTASDNVPVKVVDITPLGLMELTRKKINPSLKEQLGRLL